MATRRENSTITFEQGLHDDDLNCQRLRQWSASSITIPSANSMCLVTLLWIWLVRSTVEKFFCGTNDDRQNCEKIVRTRWRYDSASLSRRHRFWFRCACEIFRLPDNGKGLFCSPNLFTCAKSFRCLYKVVDFNRRIWFQTSLNATERWGLDFVHVFAQARQILGPSLAAGSRRCFINASFLLEELVEVG